MMRNAAEEAGQASSLHQSPALKAIIACINVLTAVLMAELYPIQLAFRGV